MKNRKIILTAAASVVVTSVVLGTPPVILSLQPNGQSQGALNWTSSYTNGIAVIQQATNLLPGAWSPYYYDIATNTAHTTSLPSADSTHGFYRLAIQTNPPDPSLVLHLPFDNDFSKGYVLDVSGHGGNAYNLNLTNPVIQAKGKWGQGGFWGYSYPMGAYSLGPYLAILNYKSFEFLTNGTVGVWAWCNTNSGQTTALVDAGYPNMTNSWSLRRYYDDRFEFVCWLNGTSTDTHLLRFPIDTVNGFTDMSTTNWHHYCVTWQGNGPAIAYYDGSPIATNTLTVPYLEVGSYQQWVAIGCWHHNNSDRPDGTGPNNGWMGGLMDDVRIYNRALAPVEVQALYNGKL